MQQGMGYFELTTKQKRHFMNGQDVFVRLPAGTKGLTTHIHEQSSTYRALFRKEGERKERERKKTLYM